MSMEPAQAGSDSPSEVARESTRVQVPSGIQFLVESSYRRSLAMMVAQLSRCRRCDELTEAAQMKRYCARHLPHPRTGAWM